MPQIPIIMPQLGESIAEATIVNFLVKAGDNVFADQDVIEVETNKATMNVTSPGSGRVGKIIAKQSESYPVGAVLGYLEVTSEEAERLGLNESSPALAENIKASSNGNGDKGTEIKQRGVEPTVRGLPVPANAKGASYLSPRMKARMQEVGLHAADMAGIAGSGSAGRVTIEDLENFLSNLEKHNDCPQ